MWDVIYCLLTTLQIAFKDYSIIQGGGGARFFVSCNLERSHFVPYLNSPGDWFNIEEVISVFKCVVKII